jgi:HK97 gp10 family phage protein
MVSLISNIKGLDEIQDAIKSLGSEQVDFKKVNDQVATELVTLLKAKIDTNKSVESGELRHSIAYYQSKKNKNFVWVGPDYRRGKNIQALGMGGGYAAHLVEYGTVARYTGVKSKYVAANLTKAKVKAGFRGVMPAKPFMRPTYDANKEGLLNKLSVGYWREIKELAELKGFKTN